MLFLNANYHNIFITDLQLSNLETKIFLLIISQGMLKIDQISIELNLDKSQCTEIIDSLINKNMIIEYSKNLFESFHPRFAIINRYKRLCLEKNMPWKKNSLIDNLAIILEQPFEAARTK
ncbi:MAG TPA: helix-turn-helix domain-containing protein [Nitrososphaeraceae archaeon]|jgi:predicted transcriptional regulator|nr:helix-turn-helix domain-containing protein [Nitrososphaeraceae archaeon]HSL13429.1 helix-turn-helix domain-containing protein [Nitrososphaeraceae archaeon]